MSSHLPTEIITNILSHLPVKSLLRFRCVCKPWCSLIKDPYFIKLHLHHANQNYIPNVIFQYGHLYSINPNSDSPFHEAKQIHYPYKSSFSLVEIIGSCNGLLCISCDEDVYCIWNPSTLEFRKLPETPMESKPQSVGFVRSVYHGFGYDESSNDYKVVRIVSFYNKRTELKSEVKVYTLRTNSWRRVEDVPYHILYYRVSGVLLNGGLHWVALQKPYPKTIISFELAEERFKVVPQLDYEDDHFHITLGVFKGCLCVLNTFYRTQSRSEIWVMKEYGVKKSWTKLCLISEQFRVKSNYYLKPSCKLLLEMSKKGVGLYDFKSEMVRCFCIRDVLKWYQSETYVQSLVSVNTGTYLLRKKKPKPKQKQEEKPRKCPRKDLSRVQQILRKMCIRI